MKNNEQPSTPVLNAAMSMNFFITSLGMVSLGLLAMLITHHNLEKKGASLAELITADVISFSTAVIGKIAIVLYFNGPVFSQKINQFYERGLKSFFTIPKRTFTQHIGWILNYLLSLNASLFWAGLVQVSFIESANILDQFDSEMAHKVGAQIRQWYVFLIFVISSFYANWLSWPGIHQSGCQQIKDTIQWLLETKKYRNLNWKITFQLKYAHHKLMRELKACIQNPEKKTPRLNAIIESLQNSNNIPTSSLSSLNESLNCILENKDIPRLRQAYLNSNKVSPVNNLSTTEWSLRHGLALLFTGVSIWGFRNVIGLSDVVWGQWMLRMISTYGARYAICFSMAEMMCLTIYPMIYQLSGILKRGIPSHVFSKVTLGFIFLIVAFVSIFGGLANAEQSDLDHEPIADIVIAELASFMVDAFGIYMVMRSFFEHRISSSTEESDTIKLKQLYLKLQKLGKNLSNTIDEAELYELEKNNAAENNKRNDHESVHASESAPLLSEKTKGRRMFWCFEEPLRRCFGIKSNQNLVNYVP